MSSQTGRALTSFYLSHPKRWKRWEQTISHLLSLTFLRQLNMPMRNLAARIDLLGPKSYQGSGPRYCPSLEDRINKTQWAWVTPEKNVAVVQRKDGGQSIAPEQGRTSRLLAWRSIPGLLSSTRYQCILPELEANITQFCNVNGPQYQELSTVNTPGGLVIRPGYWSLRTIIDRYVTRMWE